MRREVLLVAEIVDAAERIIELTVEASVESIDLDRTRREALLWSFTVLGEACGQLPDAFKATATAATATDQKAADAEEQAEHEDLEPGVVHEGGGLVRETTGCQGPVYPKRTARIHRGLAKHHFTVCMANV